MAIINEYADYDAIGLAELIKSRAVSIADVLETAKMKVATLNPRLNAFVNILDGEIDKALSQALPNGAFTGVPMGIKECVAGISGVGQRFGSRITASHIPDRDEEIISRYRRSGVVFLGQTNAPEFSSTITTESELYGVCNNPWSLDRTVGGSSGGSACAVASGMVPVASANDSAGSIRIPASCTGIFGFKPSRGRVPNGPDLSEIWGGLFVQHVLTRTVRDSAAFLDVGHGMDSGAPYTAPTYSGRYLQEVLTPPGTLTIAISTEAANGVFVDETCKGSVLKTATLLEDLGHRVIEAEPCYDGVLFCDRLRDLITISFSYEMLAHAKHQKRSINNQTVEACHRKMVEHGQSLPASALLDFYQLRAECERMMGRFFQVYDVLLTPALAMPPVKHGFINANSDDLDVYFERLWHFSPFAALANVCGLPSMSMPLYTSQEGLPTGSMFTGRYGDEATLFRLAGELEMAKPWLGRRPK